MTTARLTSKGQITLPKIIRDHLELKSGDRVEFLIGSDESVIVLPATRDIRELKGIIPKPTQPLSIEEMNASIEAMGSRKG